MELSFKNSDDAKESGNIYFNNEKYDLAYECYSIAINLFDNQDNKKLAIFYSNRANSLLQMKKFTDVIIDCDYAIKFDNLSLKPYYRKAFALYELKQYIEAKDTLNTFKLLTNKLNQEVENLLKKINEKIKISNLPNIKITKIPKNFKKNFKDNSSWSKGLSLDKQYEWLIDCYRMRVDDEYVYQCNLKALYSCENASEIVIIEDFLLFSVAAKRRNVIPSKWIWKDYLNLAENLLPYAFEKEDAKEKYGGENIFSMLTGGRSLRAVAGIIYGKTSVDSMGSEGDSFYQNLYNFIVIFITCSQ